MTPLIEGTLVIARSEFTPALRERFSFDPAVLVFSSAEAAHALGLVMQRGVPLIALDRQFVTSQSGVEFVSELRSIRPDSEIRVLSDQGGDIPVVLRRPVLNNGRTTIAASSQPIGTETRRTPRYPVHEGCAAFVNGESTALVNVSLGGVQVLSSVVLKPLQQVRVALADEEAAIRLHAAIAWSMFERLRETGETCYRVGVAFRDANPKLIEAYCTRHGIRL
jgi:hypothetical protein